MVSYSCRFFQASVFAKQAVAIFIPFAVQQKFASRIEELLHVEVLVNDGLPQRICRKCKYRLKTLERAANNLENLRN